MSFITDQVQRIDAQLDRLQLQSPKSDFSTSSTAHPPTPTARTTSLQTLVKSLSVDPTSSRPLLSASRLRSYIEQADLSSTSASASTSTSDDSLAATTESYDQELEWLLISKAVTQTYGLVLTRLLEQTVSMSDELYYWDTVLSRWRWSALYGVQTSPLRLFDFGSSVWDEVKVRSSRITDGLDIREAGGDMRREVVRGWGQFYTLVREVVRERRISGVGAKVVSPIAQVRGEVRAKQRRLREARLRGANALGVLLGEGLMNEVVHGDGLATPAGDEGGRRWKASMARNVALIDAVLAKVNVGELDVDKFDAAIAEETDEDVLYAADVKSLSGSEGSDGTVHPGMVAERLVSLLSGGLGSYDSSSRAITKEHGRPSRLIRFWLPATIGLLSSTTVLRILVNRQAEITAWIEDLGATVIDFWSNWVVEPTRKVIGTIRHDEGSEVSIMSKRSLEGDRDSLERMVVQFAIDNPSNATDSNAALTEPQIADIRSKVREGDLTPVLKAYEKDLASPFMGTVRGNLIRALLIQVQKTKVDVEVAMGGIDALLKSQELVFGFVGLTPGILVLFGAIRWFRSSFSDRKGSDQRRKQGVMIRQLRNIDRVLSNASPTDFGELHYKDQGLLLCEIHVLRQEARRSMPDLIYREFGEEMDELVDVRSGVKRQRSVVERVRWAYARWF